MHNATFLPQSLSKSTDQNDALVTFDLDVVSCFREGIAFIKLQSLQSVRFVFDEAGNIWFQKAFF